MNKYIKSDLFRLCGDTKIKSFLSTYFINSGFRYLVSIRLCKSKGIIKYIGYFLWLIARDKRMHINPKTKIGYGLYIGHGGPIVINPTAVIGNNVNLSQFTSIGSNEGVSAVIGDNCYIGPNVLLLKM